jgi:DNA topoisomerase-1
MPKQLVIVESPTKAKTLERYLGSDYAIAASKGHVRDLPEDRMGVDLDDAFHPEYVIPQEKKDTVGQLKKAFGKAESLWLATDFDREGEAIAWHVAEAIGADPRAANRVTFTEITKDAVQQAFREPRRIDFHLVDAQQTRRILDRIVGYELSPLLSKRLRRLLPAAVRGQKRSQPASLSRLVRPRAPRRVKAPARNCCRPDANGRAQARARRRGNARGA